MIQRSSLATVASLAAVVAVAACTAPAPILVPPTEGDGGVAGGCAPRPVTAPAMWIPPHALHSNLCTAQDAAAITSCFVQGQGCDVVVSATCRACAVSGDTAQYSSALIVHDQSSARPLALNIAGCVGAVSGDLSAGGCGAKLAAKEACTASSCAGCTDPIEFQSCAAQAEASVCAAANAGAQCAAPYMAQCVQGTTELEVAFNLVTLFCGP